MTKAFEVSQSKVNKWRQCRQAYDYAYVQKLRKRSVGRPLAMGRIIHEMQEVDVNGGNPFEKLDEIEKIAGKMFRDEEEEYGDIVEDVEFLMTDYYAYYEKDPLIIVPVGKRMAEHPFEVTIAPGIVATGKIDAFVKSRNDLRWILERKNHKTIPDEDSRWRNLQSCVYTRLVDMSKLMKIEGLCWDYIRTKRPTRPQLLKSGKLSKKAIDTVPSAVLAAMKEHKLTRADVAHMLASSKRNLTQYFKRIYTPTKKALVDIVFADFVETAKEMKALHGKSQVMTIGRHCSWCNYEPLCRARLRGLDKDFIIKKEYYHHEGKDNENDWETEASAG